MNKITKSALALGLISVVSLPALAAGTDGGAYIGGGLSMYQDSDTDGHGSFDSDGMGYNLYGGYQFNRIVGVELGYNDYADYKNGSKKLSPTSISVSANLGYTFDNTIRPFVLAGLSSVDLNANSAADYGDDSGTGFHFGVGVEYTPVEHLTLRLISQADAVSVDDYVSSTKIDDHTLAFNSISFGGSYNF
ncbi:Outer membrane protein beta-barrel domain-containing protein [Vibrio crassostreae]|nr:Outer membrane protein beta-barrel domain-containing protein [Vibrio crassostreae]CAK3523471.1 Outer membrane protein beta-barrel domain-containing protein [Vibrio crassostreae]CAK3541244.1 Outer membrane protein beta-barrel domain-containing protein [Vibrio crassostreae]CAK3550573.1 Outer membrane protein beta-barrel domain-containing protein [Vibrio crassostreae]CAK3578032.1 Outer membrane protein beta-barrel domain-containing protein [Vibrio crassostreae]